MRNFPFSFWTFAFELLTFQGSTASYISGGNKGPPSTDVTTIDKFDYAGESITLLAAALGTARVFSAGCTSTLKGYTVGGLLNFGTASNIIDALTFSSDTNATLGTTLNTAKGGGGALSSFYKGYTVAGQTTGIVNTIEALTYLGETTAAISAVASVSTIAPAGTSSSYKGYNSGGTTTGGAGAGVDVIDALSFSNSALITISATVTAAKNGMYAAPSTTKGYLFGGINTSSTIVNVIEALTFSTETEATISATLVVASQAGTGSPSTAKGYTFGGGDAVGRINTIEALTFVGETQASIGAVLSDATGNQNPCSFQI